MPKHYPINVSILATPDTSPSNLFGLSDVLSSVGVGWETFISGAPAEPKFNVRIVAVDQTQINCTGSGGSVLITPHARIDEVEDTDIAIIASFVPRDTISLREHDRREIDWLFKLKNSGKILVSMCTSTLLLAESGVLNGLESTTFWAYRDLARVRYPQVQWRVNQNLCISGHEGQIVTAGGATLWQELAIYLIVRFCGAEQAANTAKLWLIPNREENQAPYSVKPINCPHDDSVINDCQKWIAENYSVANPIAILIKNFDLPSSTFTRRFKQATGDRPIDYVHMIRIEKAKEILESSNMTIENVGYEVGYEDPASFRRIFKRIAGLTPSIYRRKFDRSRFMQYDI